jgi:(p)ppGpp synthase/HD superfamily hydrolase
LVLEHGGTETQAIAALLHDAIEDQPRDGETAREIGERFGSEVLRIVGACTDSLPGSSDRTAATWRARKERYLTHLREIDAAARLVSLADKVHNARAVLSDLRRIGDEVWSRFKVGKDETLWYYQALAEVFRASEPIALTAELDRTVSEMLRLAGSPPTSTATNSTGPTTS